jgi:hypothetical protein
MTIFVPPDSGTSVGSIDEMWGSAVYKKERPVDR